MQEGEAELLIANTVISELSAHGVQVLCSYLNLDAQIFNIIVYYTLTATVVLAFFFDLWLGCLVYKICPR